ncbi:MAG: hypothetical protein AAGA03_16295, partial [Planctomycetota bacterium]
RESFQRVQASFLVKRLRTRGTFFASGPMTQLSLFDAPVSPFPTPVSRPVVGQPTVVVKPSASPIPPAATKSVPPSRLSQLATQIREDRQRQSAARGREVQRLGDLAKLVLMRHELVARRRQAVSQG